ncbi:MAG: gliding motility protein GldN [Cyclobacteriaceae bacterium]|jgi:gliding motility associated protien GldN|nr:gliding motility protein GldN [Cyclobacteriaceae bacterium]
MLNPRIISCLLVVLVIGVASAQEDIPQYNPNSVDPIPRYEHLFKLRVWRVIDLNEKQNKGFFSNNGEITRLILKAYNSGEIAFSYKDDSLKQTQTKDEFLGKMVLAEGEMIAAWDARAYYYTGDPVSFNGVNYESTVDNNIGINPSTARNGEWQPTQRGRAITVSPRDITRITIMEDVIFDRRRSRLYYDIQAVKLEFLNENGGFWQALGWFKYKDLEKVFRNHPAEAVWFNRQNTAENKNFADALILRLFKGVIEKIENPDDLRIEDIYTANGRPYFESVWAREWAEIQLMEKEHNLWEY